MIKVMLCGVAAGMLAGMAGCESLANLPPVVRQLKLVSAGHTGCLPDENEITNATANADGSGIWNATCRGKVYLCTSAASVGNSMAFSCAPAVSAPAAASE